MKVLVIRFSSIGDIVLTSPVVRWLGQIENNEIHFLTKAGFIDLVVHSPSIAKVHSLCETADETITQLKAENYDLVIDLHKNIRSKRISNALGTTTKTFKKLNIQKWIFTNFKINLLPKKHIVDRYADALQKLPIDTTDKRIDFFFPIDFVRNLGNWGLREKDYICLVVGGTYYTKQIPSSTILAIHKRLNRQIVLLGGGKKDELKANELVYKMGAATKSLVGRTTLLESAFVIKHSAGIITSDTGLMHIASAFDVPIHTLWGNTHPALGMYAIRPKNESIYNHIVDLKCNPCSKLGSSTCPRGHFDCMLKQNVEQIVKNCTPNESRQ